MGAVWRSVHGSVKGDVTGNGLRFGRVFGVPIVVSYSWLGLFVLATLFMAFVQLPSLFPSATLGLHLLGGLVFTGLFFGSVIVHELAHAAVALSQKLRVRGITIMIFGGFTAVEGETTQPRTEALVAIAGPVASLVIGLMLLSFSTAVGFQANMLGFLSFSLAEINLALAILNMLPGLPLDGGRVFLAVAWRVTGSRFRGAMAAISAGRFLGLALFLVGLVALFLYADTVLGVSALLVGWFLRSAASSARQQYLQQETLKGLTAGSIAEARWPRITVGTALSSIAEDPDFMQGRRTYLVYQDGAWAGMLPVRTVKAFGPEDRRRLRVGDVMVSREDVIQVRMEDDLLAVLQAMEQQQVGYAPVQNDKGEVVGVLSRDRIQQTMSDRAAASRKGPQHGGKQSP